MILHLSFPFLFFLSLKSLNLILYLENKFKSLQNHHEISIYNAFVNTRKYNFYRVYICVSKIATNADK